MSEFEVDEEVFQGFIAEASEDLAGVESAILELETRPDDRTLLDAIFRPIHSIKGNSAFFNLNTLKQFTHELEHLLDSLRRGKQPVHPETISILLQGADLTLQAIERASQREFATELTPDEAEFLERLHNAPCAMPPETQLAQLHDNLKDLIDRIDQSLVVDLSAAADELRAQVQSMVLGRTVEEEKGAAGSATVADSALEIIRAYVEGDTDGPALSEQHLDTFEAGVAQLRDAVPGALDGESELGSALNLFVEEVRALVESPLDPDDLIVSVFVDRFEKLAAMVRAAAPIAAPDEAAAAPTEAARAKGGPPTAAGGQKTNGETDRTMRISESAVDEFMNFVGELIIVGEVFRYLELRLADSRVDPHIISDFKGANQGFNDLSVNLRTSLMNVRKLPLKQVLQRVPRMVRDTAVKVGKLVDVTIIGDDIQADKRIIEKLEAPIMHAVRNSVDHGIEPPDGRAMAGKPEKGRLVIRVEETEEALSVTVSDDGAGLDPDKLRKAAVTRDMMSETEAAALSDRDAVQLIFAPGFSTAEHVTEVSGRGVGMDVVRTNLSQIGGQVSVDSTVGEGTTVTFNLPLSNTLIVVNSIVASLGTERYLIPVDNVQTTVHGEDGQVVEIANRGEVFDYHGAIHRLIRLGDLLGVEARAKDVASATILIVEHEGNTAALIVDEVVSLQPVVVKELGPVFSGSDLVSGSAVMGDGRISLVLDCAQLVHAHAVR